MITKSPSGGLSIYYYKGGYFHGIHYGSYFNDSKSLFDMIDKEESFILNSPENRRILIDFYETNLTKDVLDRIINHLQQLSQKIIKLAISSDQKSLRHLAKAIKKSGVLKPGYYYLCTDMEEGKTWLVSDKNE